MDAIKVPPNLPLSRQRLCADKIMAQMLAKQHSYETLAAVMNKAPGTIRSTISNIRKGSLVNLDTAIKLAIALECEVDDLRGERDE